MLIGRVGATMGKRLEVLRGAVTDLCAGDAASPPEKVPGEANDLTVLKLALDDLQRENQRLRDARGALTRQLGPLPISAALLAGLVSVFPGENSEDPIHTWLTVGALVVFGVMVLLSMRYSALKPYRRLRDEHEGREAGADTKPVGDLEEARRGWMPNPASPEHVVDELVARYAPTDGADRVSAANPEPGTEAAWYAAMIEVERTIRGRYEKSSWFARVIGAIRIGEVQTLQRACDVEWGGLFIVKTLFVIVVALLILARVT